MAKYHDGAVSGSRRIMDVLLTVLLGVLCVVWLYPVLLILINSLKDELAISTATVFELPTSATFAGLHNYVYGITQLNFLQSFGYSAIITVSSVAADSAVLLDVRLVHHPRDLRDFQGDVSAVRLLDGRAVPDGDVHPLQDGRYAEAQHPALTSA